MTLVFKLSMPTNNAWNGKWSGEGRLYAKIRTFRGEETKRAEDILFNQPYYYRWKDGWSVKIKVVKIDSSIAAKIRRKSAGFCGYEWMIDSIINNGEIKTQEQEHEK